MTKPVRYKGTIGVRRVYVTAGHSKKPLAFAIYADTNRDGKLRLVARIEDRSYPDELVWNPENRCWQGRRTLTAAEKADQSAIWWREVAHRATMIVTLSP
jgi:hypothetical protein